METEALPIRHPSVRRPPDRRLTFDEFLAWVDEGEHAWAEWVDGEVIVLAPASLPHSRITTFLVMVMQTFAEGHGLGQVLTPPFLMRLREIKRGREPDLLFVAGEHFHRLRHTYLDGPADLVVEIISPESRTTDRGAKLAEYAAAGVPEYWLIDPDLRQADFFRLGPQGTYVATPADEHGDFRSGVLPGFWLRVDWLWQEWPDGLGALHELGLLGGPRR